MTFSNGPEVRSEGSDAIAGDRRTDRRYDIHLELRWKLVRRRRVLDNGIGHTIDLSSGGILFDAGRSLPVGLNVELSVAWPVLLHNVAPLQLIVTGRITRTVGHRIGIRIMQHEFRTVGTSEHRVSTMRPSAPPVLFAPHSRNFASGSIS